MPMKLDNLGPDFTLVAVQKTGELCDGKWSWLIDRDPKEWHRLLAIGEIATVTKRTDLGIELLAARVPAEKRRLFQDPTYEPPSCGATRHGPQIGTRTGT